MKAIMGERPGSALTLPAWPTLRWRIDMPDGTCSVEGCEDPSRKRGWCNRHYHIFRAHGDVVYQRPSEEERFFAKVNKTETCWLWTGARLPLGYGQFVTTGNRLAHRFAYEHFVGPIPDGLTIDHLCRNPSCVNPAHMEAVTIQVNLSRGTSGPANNARKTHCLRGHELAGPNLMMNGKYRQCRTCRNEAQNRRYRERTSTA
jgi:hypothetical protein